SSMRGPMSAIGTHLQTVVSSLANREKQQTSALSVSSPAVKPAVSAPEADCEIPNRLWSSWTPDVGPRAIIRAFEESEKAALTARKNELEIGLQPIGKEGSADRELADGTLTAMISGFRSMRLTPDQLEARVRLLLMVLAEFPAWAIADGCQK